MAWILILNIPVLGLGTNRLLLNSEPGWGIGMPLPRKHFRSHHIQRRYAPRPGTGELWYDNPVPREQHHGLTEDQGFMVSRLRQLGRVHSTDPHPDGDSLHVLRVLPRSPRGRWQPYKKGSSDKEKVRLSGICPVFQEQFDCLEVPYCSGRHNTWHFSRDISPSSKNSASLV